MANLSKTTKIIIPSNKPFSVEYKGAKLNLEQDFYYEGGGIYIHIPGTIYRSADSIGDLSTTVLPDHFQKNLSHLDWANLNPDNIVICDFKQSPNGIWSITPNLEQTKMVQESYRIEPFDLSDSDLCFQYSDGYNAIDDRIDEIEYVHTENIKGINNWLSGDHYQIVPTCDKWEHLRSYTGDSMADAVFSIQCQVEEPPKHIDLDSHLRSFHDSMSRNSSSIPVDMQERLRKLQSDYVSEHNDFVDRWLKM